MSKRAIRGVLVLALAVAVAAPAAASDLWLHVKVREDRGSGAKVTVNLPLTLLEKAIPLLPEHVRAEAHGHLDRHDLEIAELRELWNELRAGPDMTFVTVEEGDGETVRVWKEKGFLRVDVDEDGGETVRVRVPTPVVDALLAGDEMNFEAAVQALVELGEGEIVTVDDRKSGDHVRVWIDRQPEAGE